MTARRIAACLVLLALGIVSLPVTAYFLDGLGRENWIVPVQLAVMAVVGALVGLLVPVLAGADARPRRGALVGAGLGVGAAVVGAGVFFLLLSAPGGA
jgi:hypothetical protein